MKISLLPIKDVTGATLRIETSFQLDPFTMGRREFSFPAPLELDAVITNLEDLYLVQGCLSLQLGLHCSRCLEPMTQSLSMDISEEFDPDGEEIVEDILYLRDRLLENILLEIPQKPLCSEDCKGLCPRCGQDQNQDPCHCEKEGIDPRLAGLKDYFKENS